MPGTLCATPARSVSDVWALIDVGDCWEWAGGSDADGYGLVRLHGRLARVHRLVWSELIGPIAPGLQLDHLCRNQACCNPDHMQPVTHRENALRGYSFSAANAAKDTCVHGHPFTPENTYVRPHEPNGRRDCRACIRERVRRYRTRRVQTEVAA